MINTPPKKEEFDIIIEMSPPALTSSTRKSEHDRAWQRIANRVIEESAKHPGKTVALSMNLSAGDDGSLEVIVPVTQAVTRENFMRVLDEYYVAALKQWKASAAARKVAREAVLARWMRKKQNETVDRKIANVTLEIPDQRRWDEVTDILGPDKGNIFDLAKRWGCLMQVELTKGAKLEDIWQATSAQADNGDLYRYFSTVVDVLGETWSHGSELRRIVCDASMNDLENEVQGQYSYDSWLSDWPSALESRLTQEEEIADFKLEINNQAQWVADIEELKTHHGPESAREIEQLAERWGSLMQARMDKGGTLTVSLIQVARYDAARTPDQAHHLATYACVLLMRNWKHGSALAGTHDIALPSVPAENPVQALAEILFTGGRSQNGLQSGPG